MFQGLYAILSNTRLTDSMMQLSLAGDTASITAPGQFVNIKIDGFYLRRPLSICDWRDGRVTLLYKIVGGGTEALSRMRPGQTLDMLCGLGNGFQTERGGQKPLLIGGGAGIAPMYGLGRALLERGVSPTVVLGFNTESEIFYKREFEALGLPLLIATADGSFGTKGFVTDAMAGLSYDYFYACGPMPMFRAIEKMVHSDGQYSFEERMGCGFGACMGCTCKTKYGSKRICKDGPVLMREEVIW